MASQYVWIGIIFAVFSAGLGMGYVAFQQGSHLNYMVLNPQQMQQMMNDPKQMTMWNQQMMNEPQAVQQIHDMMINDPRHMSQMMGPMMNYMMNDPQMQQQMLTMMMQNPTMMNSMMNDMQMMNMLNQTIGTNTNTQSPNHTHEVINQMKQDHQFTQDVIMAMLNDPDMRLQMIGHMTENQEAMQEMKMMLNSTDTIDHMMNNQMNP